MWPPSNALTFPDYNRGGNGNQSEKKMKKVKFSLLLLDAVEKNKQIKKSKTIGREKAKKIKKKEKKEEQQKEHTQKM